MSIKHEIDRTVPQYVEVLVWGGDLRREAKALLERLVDKYGTDRHYFVTDEDGEFLELRHHKGRYLRIETAEFDRATGSPVLVDKGDLGGECNRSECFMAPAFWFNKSTKKYYCQHCAFMINEAAPLNEVVCEKVEAFDYQKWCNRQ